MNPLLQTKPHTRTENVSFRIEGDLRNNLQEEAIKMGVSLNGLVSQIFARYIAWGRYADRLKLIPVSKDLLRELFVRMEDGEAIEIGRRFAETSGREHILFLFQETTLESVLHFMEIWRSHFDASQHRYYRNTHFFTLHHDINLNFSLFVKEYVSTLFQTVAPRNLRFETVSNNSVTFSFEG